MLTSQNTLVLCGFEASSGLNRKHGFLRLSAFHLVMAVTTNLIITLNLIEHPHT